MKIVELIKSFKFLDFRKYISVNLFIVVFFAYLILEFIHANTVYPPPVEVSGWGEPHFEYSPEEEKNMTLTSICILSMIFSPFVFLFELLSRIIIEFIIKKFFPKMFNGQAHTSKFKLPKFINIVYSIIFYTGFLAFVAILLSYLFFSFKSLM